jgi:predicted branched-subunit amino acid permease
MREGFWLTGFGVFIFWNLFTVAGALGAKAMGNPSAWGLDAAVPAAFLGLVWPRLKNTTDKLLALIAAVFAIITTLFLPAGLPIIGTAVIAIIAGLRKAK